MHTEKAIPDSITGAVALSREAAKTLLLDIIERCGQRLVVFDLDSTLLSNRPRSARIMREYAKSAGQPLLAKADQSHFPTWSAYESLLLLGMKETEVDEVIDDYLNFWAQRFFTSEYCKQDLPIDGAVLFVNAIHKAGGIVTYLTGRDETMRTGTVESLQAHGFVSPDNAEVSLIMKPEASDSDDEYKHLMLQQMAQSSAVVAAFDNEPAHINSYRDVFPDCTCVHLDTDHSMRKVRLLPEIISIRDFRH